MLVVGVTGPGPDGLRPAEWATHFSLWAMAAAPLWAGVDLRRVSRAALDVFLVTLLASLLASAR